MTLDEFANDVGWRLFVVEIDDVLWATDSYFLTPYADSLAEQLLRHWNLDGPGEYHIVRSDGDDDDDDDFRSLPRVHVSRSGDVPEKTISSARALVAAKPTIPLEVVFPVPGRPAFIRIGTSYCAVTTRPVAEHVFDHVFLKDDLLRIVAGPDWHDLPLSQVDGVRSPVWIGPGLLVPMLATS